jgi:hypothetical protein
MFRREPSRLLSTAGVRAIRRYAAARAILPPVPAPPRGRRAGFMHHADPALRKRLDGVFAQHFGEEDPAAYDDVLDRCDRLSAWLTEPLQSPAYVLAGSMV